MPNVIGIDLGTSYSSVGVFKDGKVEIIADENGNLRIPSFVAFSNSECIVGTAAKNQAIWNPCKTVYGTKRLFGRRFDDADVQSDMRHWPFRMIGDENGRPTIQVKYRGETVSLFPEEILTLILTKIKAIAETHLKTAVTDAVITVPAYFNSFQRQATEDAATAAGLNVLQIVSSPVAAAMAFGLENKKMPGERNALIFDLGGNSVDIAVVTIENGIFEVKSVAGDTHHGGEDCDHRMVNHFVAEFRRKHRTDLTSNPHSMTRLKIACERAKCTLSYETEAPIELDSLLDGIDFYSSITRARFEQLCEDLFRHTFDPLEKAIRDARINRHQIQDIVLVGGSTRIPRIRKLLSQYFPGKQLITYFLKSDDAAAHSGTYGAAIQAAILSGDKSENIQDMLLLDVVPFSLGIEIAGGEMIKIVKRNTTVPTINSQTFTTYLDNQLSLSIMIYQGERKMAIDCNLLGKFEFPDIPPAPRGVPQFEVTFDLDTKGTIIVSAQNRQTPERKSITITNVRNVVPNAENFSLPVKFIQN